MFAIKKGLHKITAYHCRHCGGIVEPGEEICEYCRNKSKYADYNGKMPKHQVRIMFDCGEDFVYFDTIQSIEVGYEQDIIDTTTLYDERKKFIRPQNRNQSIGVSMPFTDRGCELIGMIFDDSIVRTRFEFLSSGFAYEADTYISRHKEHFIPDANSLMMMDFTLTTVDGMEYNKKIVPEDCKCPNCGAPINSRYGACDFCGGWIEWEY